MQSITLVPILLRSTLTDKTRSVTLRPGQTLKNHVNPRSPSRKGVSPIGAANGFRRNKDGDDHRKTEYSKAQRDNMNASKQRWQCHPEAVGYNQATLMQGRSIGRGNTVPSPGAALGRCRDYRKLNRRGKTAGTIRREPTRTKRVE